MSASRRLAGTAVVVTTLAMGPYATAGDDNWITIERGAARRALAGLAAAGHPGALVIMDAGSSDALGVRAQDTDIVVAHIDQRDFDLLPGILHAALRQCGGFVWHPTQEDAEATAARANTRFVQRIPEPPIEYTIDNGPVVQALMAPMQEINVRNTIMGLGGFYTRYHDCGSGQSSALWIRDLWYGLSAGRTDVTVQLFGHASTPQPSVILTIPGTTLGSEVVVLGGHQDSTIIGSNAGNCMTARAPGEDDDASGIASLTEVIRVAMATDYRPLRTVQFMAYAGEEAGLRGSKEIALAYRQQNVNVVGVLQLDMTNFKGTPTGDIYLFTSHTDPTQNAFVGSLVDTYLPSLVRGTSQCTYACSDHWSWWDRGYPASFPFESTFGDHNPDIHTINDTIDKSGGTANHALKFTRLAGAYMAEVAKGCTVALNQSPVANAGADHQVSPLVTSLDGRGSFDPDGWPGQVTYSWTQISGPPVTIEDATSALARFRAPFVRATYGFRLTMSDGCETATDEVTVLPRTEP